MLPKPEKTKKLNKNLLEDFEITKESDEVVAARRLKSKRRLVLISLGLTVGLSFIFWSFRSIQDYTKSPHSFNFPSNFNFHLPQINLKTKSTSSSSTSDAELKNFLENKNWSVSSSFITPTQKTVFSFNSANISPETEIQSLLPIEASQSSFINLNLPQGLSFQEEIIQSPYITYKNLIRLPSSQLLILVSAPGVSSLDQIKNDLSQLVNLLYWYSVSQINFQ